MTAAVSARQDVLTPTTPVNVCRPRNVRKPTNEVIIMAAADRDRWRNLIRYQTRIGTDTN